ncbi:MAG TPA: hypothetical protein PLS10_12255, partial [Chitinophagales bacterium]|nr:hypothetical protein [Chitinophagales bacterium]
MKNFYLKIFSFISLLLLLSVSNKAFAQKNLKLKILSVNFTRATGTDCDGGYCLSGDGPMDIVFDIDDGGTDVDEDCHEGADNTTNYTWNANFNVWDRNYDYGCQWPTGNINFKVEAWERDQTACIKEQCSFGDFLNAFSDKICDVPMVIPWPSNVNGTYAGTPQTCTFNANYDGDGNCTGTITVNYQWEVTGNWKAQSSDDYICGAYNLGGLSAGATLSRTNFNNYGYSSEDICSNNEPNVSNSDETIWLKFKTGANPGTNINVDVSADGGTGSGGACAFGEIVAGWCKVYEGPDNLSGCPFSYSVNHFSANGINQVGSTGLDLSDIDIKCPKPNQTY